MALVSRDELNLECRVAGRLVEKEAKEAEAPLENEDLDRIFKPVLDFVEEKATSRVLKEVEEDRARQEDEHEEEQQRGQKRERAAEITETVTVHVKKKSMRGTKRKVMNSYDFLQIEQNAPNSLVLEVTRGEEPEDLDSEDPDIMAGDADDEAYDDYRENAVVVIKPDYARFIGKSERVLARYVRKTSSIQNVSDMISFLKKIKRSGILKWSHGIPTCLELLEALREKEVPRD